MEIKVADIAKLRQMTGAGMMDCKKALVEAEGDFARAQEIIREKGKLVAAKRADRTTSEGAVIAKVDGNKAILVSLGCETDFVAKNAEFQALAQSIAEAAINAFPANKEELGNVVLSNGDTVDTAVSVQTGKTGEKHVIACYETIEAPFVASYIHVVNGKLASIVGFSKEIPAEDAKGIAIQVATMNPVAVGRDTVPAQVLADELAVAVQKTRDELVLKAVQNALKKAGINPAHVDSEDHIESNMAKGWITAEQAEQARQIIATVSAEKLASLPEAQIQQIAQGRVAKFLKENTLEEQEYQMADDKISVREYLAKLDKDAKILGFKRFSLAD